MEIDQIIDVQITRETAQVRAAGFGIPLVFGIHTRFAERIRYYASLAAMATDGFISSDAEYKAAAKLFGQEVKPESVAIGRRVANAPGTAQVNTITPTPADVAAYVVVLNGVIFSFVSDGDATPTEIVTGLKNAINAGTEPVTATGTTTLVLTADVPGVSFTVSVSSNLANVLTTPNSVVSNVADELDALMDSSVTAKAWYALMLTSRVDEDILAAAGWIEANKRIFIACSGDPDIKDSGVTTDIASDLQDAGYARTAILYSEDQANYPEAAWLGRMLPTEPGSATWANKDLSGIAKDDLTENEIATIEEKGANYYVEIGGLGVTLNGATAEPEWLDVMVGVDWITARMGERVFALIQREPKVPYTDAGISQIVGEMGAVLQEAVERSILAAPAPETRPWTISAPLAKNISAVQKATRELVGVTFDGYLAGAIHRAELRGTVHY